MAASSDQDTQQTGTFDSARVVGASLDSMAQHADAPAEAPVRHECCCDDFGESLVFAVALQGVISTVSLMG